MKFTGELRFPEIDHPGVPVQFVIEGAQAELVVEGESLGRWSLYDVHARRLVASAFQIDLDGTEVTFVASDPIDFAYRGVEHMAQTWATMKSKRMGGRSIAVRKSRRDTMPSRLDDLRIAMESNLETYEPKPLAGENSMPSGALQTETVTPTQAQDWDQRDQAGAIPMVGETPEEVVSTPEVVGSPALPEQDHALSEQQRWLEEEKQRIAEERARLESERLAAEQREANLLEAYRLEMERLEAERAEVRRQAEDAAAHASLAAEEVARVTAEREAAEVAAAQRAEADRVAAEQMAREAAERASAEREAAELAAREAEERAAAELARAEETAREAAEQAAREAAEHAEHEAAEQVAREAEEGRVAAANREFFRRRNVLDLKDLEDGAPGLVAARLSSPDPDEPTSEPPAPARSTAPTQPEPVLAGTSKEKSGLMGAVKAAFRGGPRDHDHQFVEAPGGIGITRYVCEECGYVSISVGS